MGPPASGKGTQILNTLLLLFHWLLQPHNPAHRLAVNDEIDAVELVGLVFRQFREGDDVDETRNPFTHHIDMILKHFHFYGLSLRGFSIAVGKRCGCDRQGVVHLTLAFCIDPAITVEVFSGTGYI